MPSGWRVCALVAAFFAVVFGVIWMALRYSDSSQPTPTGLKRLSGTVAEKFSYRVPNEPFPRASCDACRIGKLKVGPFSLGALNVVEFDNLVVNVPPSGFKGKDGDHGSEKFPGSSAVDVLNLGPLVSLSQSGGGRLKKQFHGIKINGFALNKMEGRALVPIASAALVRNSRRTIVLKDVVLRRNQGEERIAEARLELKPRVAIVWPGGVWYLESAL